MVNSSMTSRERVLAAAKGEPVDRTPVWYWLNAHMVPRLMAEFQPSASAVHNLVARVLWKRFVRQGELEAAEWTRLLPFFLDEYANSRYVLELGSDVAYSSPGEFKSAGAVRKRLYRENGCIRYRDPLGCIRGLGGIYAEVIEYAIQEVGDLARYRFPNMTHTAGLAKLRQACPDVCILSATYGVQQPLADLMWGPSRFMMALYDHPDEVAAFQQRMADWSIEIARSAVAAGTDIVMIGDDYGTQDRPLLSMEMWLEFTYPHLKRIIEAVHDAGALALLHSCGYQMPFLKYYVEAGLDMLHGFQPSAGNDFEAAVEAYGDRLTFVTGIDVQRGELVSARELRQEILRFDNIGARKGRHVLATTNYWQYTMPGENVRAVLDTVREIQAGVHRV